MTQQRYKAVTHDGWTIKPGDVLRDHHNEEWVYVSCYGKLPPSTGRVVVHQKGSTSLQTQEFYPGVFNLKVVPA